MGPLGPQHLIPPQQQQPQQQLPSMGHSAMRQLFAAALNDHRHFLPPPRRPAWEPKAVGSNNAAAAAVTAESPGDVYSGFAAGMVTNAARAGAPSSAADVSPVGCESAAGATQLPPR